MWDSHPRPRDYETPHPRRHEQRRLIHLSVSETAAATSHSRAPCFASRLIPRWPAAAFGPDWIPVETGRLAPVLTQTVTRPLARLDTGRPLEHAGVELARAAADPAPVVAWQRSNPTAASRQQRCPIDGAIASSLAYPLADADLHAACEPRGVATRTTGSTRNSAPSCWPGWSRWRACCDPANSTGRGSRNPTTLTLRPNARVHRPDPM